MDPRDKLDSVLRGLAHCLLGSGIAALASALVLMVLVRMLVGG